MLGQKPRIVPLPPVLRVANLSTCCQLCEEFIHVFQSIALLESLKHTVDLVCVIRGP